MGNQKAIISVGPWGHHSGIQKLTLTWIMRLATLKMALQPCKCQCEPH